MHREIAQGLGRLAVAIEVEEPCVFAVCDLSKSNPMTRFVKTPAVLGDCTLDAPDDAL